jgi:predicted peptidase
MRVPGGKSSIVQIEKRDRFVTFEHRNLRSYVLAGVALCALIGLGFIQSVSAQMRGSFQRLPDSRVKMKSYRFEEINKKMEYALFVPKKVKEKKKIKKAEDITKNPLIVFLHGWGAPATEFMRDNMLDLAQEGNYIVVGPLGYSVNAAFGVPMSPAKLQPTKKDISEGRNINELSEKDVMNVLKIICDEYYIDENRIYLLGISAGGAGAIHLGVKYASKWAAIAAVAPAAFSMRPAVFTPVKDTLPVIFVHGDADKMVPVELSRSWVKEMREMHMDYKYIEIQGGTHANALYAGMPGILAFFKEHTKTASR